MSSQAIQVYSKLGDPIAASIQMGAQIARSGMFSVDRIETGAVMMLACITEGLTPFELARTYDIVEGKLRKKALACFAEFRAKGGRVKWVKTGEDGIEAAGEFTFEEQTLTVKFSIEDARKQGIVRDKSAWMKTPGNMLRARVISNAIGMLAPEIVAGVVDGESDDAPTPEPKRVFVTETAPTPSPQPKVETKIIEAEVVKPAETPTPTPEPKKEIFIAKANEKGLLTNETAEALGEIIGGGPGGESAIAWLAEHKWIENGEVNKLSVDRAQRIFNNQTEFLNYVKGVK